MTSKMPITLTGHLGERHRYLNSLVTEAYNSGEPLKTLLESSESSPVDCLFKIDLASKHRQLEYIFKSLKNYDMLYVCRALKSTWLLEEQYYHIISPDNLEDALYPYMTTTAVNKMKHWIHLNLRDSSRCQVFYKYYSEKEPDYAFKFLCKCPAEIILNEFPKLVTLEKITPHRLKILCERTPVVAKLFFDMLSSSTTSLTKYRQKDCEYFDIVKYTVKPDIDTFLDIAEKYFVHYFKRLSADSTKFIMTHRKDRFLQKPELYIARILDVNTVARCLTSNECEDLVMQLARARYLADEHWFSYKNVEPLLKRVDFTKRASIRKKVFVDKDVGEIVTAWPYAVPKNLYSFSEDHDDDVDSVFLEVEEHDNEFIYDHFGKPPGLHRYQCCPRAANFAMRCLKRKTPLDSLFEEYRFSNFDKTLYELRQKLKAESSSQMRMYMYLVLVSKSGGRPEKVATLFDLLMKYKNEPCQVRAAVIRSLVKRVSVWRVSEDTWTSLLIYGRDLGLDGNVSETYCIEGIHAVVIRALLKNQICEPAIKAAFLSNFSTLSDYSFRKIEKEQIKETLLRMLIESAEEEQNTKASVQVLEHAIDTLQAYKTPEKAPELISVIKKLSLKDSTAVKCLLERLFRLRLLRKELYRENFDLVQTDSSYINALKHDISILSVEKFLENNVSDKLGAEQFLTKLNIYFSTGENDLASQFLIAIKKAKVNKNLARPIAYLIGEDLKSYILELDQMNDEYKRFSAFIRANAHLARPALNLDSIEWQRLGAKLIANRVIKCKAIDVDDVILKLLKWNKTARLAVILAQRTTNEADIFAAVAKIRPVVVLKTALAYFRHKGNQSDFRIWNIVRPLIVNVKKNTSPHLLNNVRNVDSIPVGILPGYLTEVFKVISEIDFNKSLGLLYRIKVNLSKVDEHFVGDVLKEFVENRFTLDKFIDQDYEFHTIAKLYLSILGKYLLLCKSADTQKYKLENVGQLYFDRLQTFWESKKDNKQCLEYLAHLALSMRHAEVYLDDEFVSCLPVMEKFLDWMRSIIPVEKHFLAFLPFQLNVLYYKTIRQAVTQIPGLLRDKEKRDEGYKIVGETFGRYVTEEARALANSYFDSIVMVYRLDLVKFFSEFKGKGGYRVAPHFIKGVIDTSRGIECTLALYLYEDIQHSLREHEKENIHNHFRQKNLLEMQFCYENWSK